MEHDALLLPQQPCATFWVCYAGRKGEEQVQNRPEVESTPDSVHLWTQAHAPQTSYKTIKWENLTP